MTRQTSVVKQSSLEELRQERGLSREGLADQAGVSLRTLERIEAGRSTPHRATIKALADALGVDSAEISVAGATA